MVLLGSMIDVSRSLRLGTCRAGSSSVMGTQMTASSLVVLAT